MKKRKVFIDVATIYPGQGGAGGGIWSYARNLLLHLDKTNVAKSKIEFTVLANSEFALTLENIKVKRLSFDFKRFWIRLLYIHAYLPFYVLYKRAVLHKTYFEAPLYCPFKTVLTVHDCMSDFYKERFAGSQAIGQRLKTAYIRWITKVAIKNSFKICTPSNFVKQEIIAKYQVSSRDVCVTPLATIAGVKDNAIKRISNGCINLYCIAAFHPHKGHFRLIEIFEVMIKKFQVNAKLLLRGHIHDFAYFDDLISKIALSPARERIEIVKYDRSSTLQEIYMHADWMVLLSEYEGFGLPVIEAQSFGTPVICSLIPTFSEVAGDSVAYLDREMPTVAAASSLQKILQNEAARNHLIEKGFENVKRYSWEQFAEQMAEVYLSVI